MSSDRTRQDSPGYRFWVPWVPGFGLYLFPEREQQMAQSLSNVLIHIIFSTKNRHSWLKDADVRSRLYAYLNGTLTGEGCSPILVGGFVDHLHILCQLSRTVSVADLVKRLKRSSSIWMKDEGGIDKFAWQSGYGAFSIGQSQVEQVKGYISRQEEHHRRISFQDEFRAFLRRYRVQYDERYVWD